MSSLLKLRRGSTVSHAGFTGAEGELTYNTDTHELVSHDGATAGGFPHVKAGDLAASSGASLMGYMPAGTGAKARSTQSKLRDCVNLFDFMTAEQIADARTGNPVLNHSTALWAAMAAGKRLYINGDKGEVYRVSKYPNTANLEVIGIGRPTINLFLGDTPVMVQFGSNSRHENIKFQSTETNLEWQRATLENASNAYLFRCGFHGFRNPVVANSWGLYLKNSTDCTIDNCDFGDNTQSDIAVVDNNRNITIINPTNYVDANGVHLNIEPNDDNGVVGLNVQEGRYRTVSLLENSFIGYAAKGIKFSGATIKTLMYAGSGVHFDDSCIIESITNAKNTIAMGGNLNMSLSLSRNLIDDPYLIDLALSNAAGQWTAGYVSDVWSVDKIRDSSGTYTRLNAAGIKQAHTIKSKKLPLLTGTKSLLLMQVGRQHIPVGAGWIGNRTTVEYFTAGDVSLGETRIPTSRGVAGTTTIMQPHFAVVIPPATTSYVKIFLGDGRGTSTICDHIVAVGLWEIESAVPSVNTREIATTMTQTPTVVTRASQIPNTANHVGGFVGDRVINLTPAVAAPKAWICTASGKPGTWVSEGNL